MIHPSTRATLLCFLALGAVFMVFILFQNPSLLSDVRSFRSTFFTQDSIIPLIILIGAVIILFIFIIWYRSRVRARNLSLYNFNLHNQNFSLLNDQFSSPNSFLPSKELTSSVSPKSIKLSEQLNRIDQTISSLDPSYVAPTRSMALAATSSRVPTTSSTQHIAGTPRIITTIPKEVIAAKKQVSYHQSLPAQPARIIMGAPKMPQPKPQPARIIMGKAKLVSKPVIITGNKTTKLSTPSLSPLPVQRNVTPPLTPTLKDQKFPSAIQKPSKSTNSSLPSFSPKSASEDIDQLTSQINAMRKKLR